MPSNPNDSTTMETSTSTMLKPVWARFGRPAADWDDDMYRIDTCYVLSVFAPSRAVGPKRPLVTKGADRARVVGFAAPAALLAGTGGATGAASGCPAGALSQEELSYCPLGIRIGLFIG